MHDVVQIKPGVGFTRQRLTEMIPDTEMLLFVAKLYDLDKDQLSAFMYARFGTSDVVTSLLGEAEHHSQELQTYLVEIGYEDLIERGLAAQAPRPPHAEILPEVWKSMEIEIATSIKEVAEKLGSVIGHMPGKKGRMVMESMMVMNAKRPTVGDHRAKVKHAGAPDNLVVLDVSGSMSEGTVRTIIDEVVGLAWEANAYLAIVSTTARWWGPGEYDSDTVLQYAQFGGTHYETLAPLFDNRHWGVVVSIADYDSSWGAKEEFEKLTGSIDKVLDISLVNSPTFLSEVLGVIADEVKPILVGNDYYMLR